MKKIINYFSFLMLCFVFAYTGCISIEPSLPVEEASLIGKTKEEVLRIVFEKTPDPHSVGINLSLVKKRGGWHCFRFKSIEEARNKTIFMDSDEWIIFVRDSLLPMGKDYFLRVKFENGELVSTKRGWTRG